MKLRTMVLRLDHGWFQSIFFYGGDGGKERLVYGWKLIKSVWLMVFGLFFGGMKENQGSG
jgi:hypothetical protein